MRAGLIVGGMAWVLAGCASSELDPLPEPAQGTGQGSEAHDYDVPEPPFEPRPGLYRVAEIHDFDDPCALSEMQGDPWVEIYELTLHIDDDGIRLEHEGLTKPCTLTGHALDCGPVEVVTEGGGDTLTEVVQLTGTFESASMLAATWGASQACEGSCDAQPAECSAAIAFLAVNICCIDPDDERDDAW